MFLCAWLWYCGTTCVLARKRNIRVTAASPAFANFIQEHGRSYRHGSREYELRRAVFESRVADIDRQNRQPNRLWTAGTNHLTDRTDEELAQLRGWRGAAVPRARSMVGDVNRYSHRAMLLSFKKKVYAEAVLWTNLSATNTILDQGACGSCWAIASITVLAAHSEIYKPAEKRTFSAQHLVSCVQNPHNCGGTGGCDGATVELAMNHVMRHGISDEQTVPYTAETTPCTAPLTTQLLGADVPQQSIEELTAPGDHVADISMAGPSLGLLGWSRLPENKYEPLMRAIAEHGPVAVSVAALTWSSYRSGVFDGCNKDAVIDHAVTLIGYGVDHDIKWKFWLIQNSWGEGWGENGKIRLLRRDSDEVEQCGIDRQPEVGTGCIGGPSEVQVCGMCGILYDNVVPYFA